MGCAGYLGCAAGSVLHYLLMRQRCWRCMPASTTARAEEYVNRLVYSACDMEGKLTALFSPSVYPLHCRYERGNHVGCMIASPYSPSPDFYTIKKREEIRDADPIALLPSGSLVMLAI